ncbi:ABC transporter permease [Paenibacillus radicis (ex Gao et al. 2016)]|uniref:Putative hemin transport system permease protein HrtB n=1 Tax=Paenibacillus radicis (ex Gao et al. 2016) TaxID=1737354 RepID=A0A917H9W8_9BACL|nr:ABC transporter permease [Paenibacillus radicis (ex Gao et al. 2016)]GGG72413.1 ABC transporter permease [Paenibacillus radicis (ex Gao et al. 2016)]
MYLALREIRFAKTRYVMIILIMLLISFLVLFVTGLAKGLAYANASSIKNMAASHFILQKDSDHRFGRSQLTEDTLTAAQQVAGDDNATPINLRMATVTEQGLSLKSDVTLFAIDMASWLAPKVIEGQTITNDTQGQVLVDRKLKEAGIKVGSVLVDQMTGASWTVSGFVANESYSHTPSIFMNEKDWLQLQSFTPVKGQNASDKSYNAIALKATGEQLAQLRAELADTDIISKSDTVSAVPGYKEEQGSLLMMIAFLYVISAMVLAVFFFVITIQKMSQFGILKAIGAKTGYLARNVVGQVLLLSIGSLAVSLGLIRIVYAVLPASMPFQLDSSTVLLSCSLFIVTAVLGSLLSVYKVSRTDALDAIGRTAA